MSLSSFDYCFWFSPRPLVATQHLFLLLRASIIASAPPVACLKAAKAVRDPACYLRCGISDARSFVYFKGCVGFRALFFCELAE